MYNEIFSLYVLCVLCLIRSTYSISNSPPAPKTDTRGPDRRFYFYNPEILPHAAAALGMLVPPTFYKPMATLGPSLAPVHFADYGDEEEEEVEEHDEKPPLQLFTILKPQKMLNHNKKKKKKKGHQHQHQHQHHKPLKQFQKLVRKCLPFKLRIIKKSDIDNNDDVFYQNIRSQLPYGYGDEYFPQPPAKQELAVISLNTSNISENGARFPQVLHFLYPRYNIQQPRPKPRIPPPRKTYRFARPPNMARPFKPTPRRPWPKVNPWRLAPAGRPVSEYPLKEPTPDAVGGSPPPSPLFHLYKDPRIPVSQAYVVGGQTESSGVTPNYIHIQPSTPSQIQYYQEEWKRPLEQMEVNPHLDINSHNGYKYSDPDYYRYGTYNQNQLHQEEQGQGYIEDQEPQSNTNYDTISHSYHNFATTSEKIVTVTPTTSWVPIAQLNRAPQVSKEHEQKRVNKFRNSSNSDHKQIHYMSGGFKNLSNAEKGSGPYQFGDKIVATRNCSSSRNSTLNNCLERGQNSPDEAKGKTHKRIASTRGGSKYYNKQKGINLRVESGLAKYSAQNKKNENGMQNRINDSNARFYVEEVPVGHNDNGTHTYKNLNKTKGRSYNQEMKSETEIVTAKYPQDNFSKIDSYIEPNGSVRAGRSNFKGFSAVVSGSMLVKDK